jgi:hypothetical protein
LRKAKARRKGEGLMYSIKAALLPSFIIIFMGTVDCVTTVIGLLYFGAVEQNPLMAGIANNIPLFMVIKLAATCCIAGTYILANKILNNSSDKTTRGFRYSSVLIKATYVGLVVFLAVVVINNLVVLFS